MYKEVLRIVEAIHRDKDIDKEVIFQGIESALQSAAKKKYGSPTELTIKINRENGEIYAHTKDGERVDPPELGRIAAQTAKQLIIQKIREAERDVIFAEFEHKRKEIVTGHVHRLEGPNLIVNLGKTEGILPRQEQVPDEHYHPGDRIRAYVLEVKKVGQKVKIILSRTHPNFIKKLFELEVPEIAQNLIEINNVVREAGYRTKIAVSSKDPKIDCVGACVGIRGTRIKSIIDELGGEKIDIIRWDDEPQVLIENALKPADISSITLDYEAKKAKVVVQDEQLSLAIGKKGQNVRLAAKLCKWDIDIITESQENLQMNKVIEQFRQSLAISEAQARRLYEHGITCHEELQGREIEELADILGMEFAEVEELLQPFQDQSNTDQVALEGESNERVTRNEQPASEPTSEQHITPSSQEEHTDDPASPISKSEQPQENSKGEPPDTP